MRKKLLHIIYLASTILLFSCSREADVAYELPAHTTRAQLSIDLVNNGDVEQQEKLHAVYRIRQYARWREAGCE